MGRKEIRAAAVDAQRITDWLLVRERERSLGDEQAEQERLDGGADETQDRDEPERPPQTAPGPLLPRRRRPASS